ncbi:hypothetical protein G9A89_009645 [Geosiphon pyriformis]|nr:hypothetical protein G9A89_009645 [Geosiphon pyriformis]
MNRRTYFLFLCLFIFTTTLKFVFKGNFNKGHNHAFFTPSLGSISKISFAKRSLLQFQGESAFSEINTTTAENLYFDPLKLRFECDNIYDHKDKCAFVRRHCKKYSSGLFNYLEFYFCGLDALKLIILSFLFTWLLFLFGFVGVAASDFFCPNLSTIAAKLNLSESMAGVTFLAFGNGSPDVFSTFSAMSNFSGSLAIGELIGAASFISSVVAGSMAVITPFHVTRVPFIRDLLFFTGAILFLVCIIWDGEIHLWESVSLVLFYLIYVSVVVVGTWWVKRNKRRRWLEQKAREEYTHVMEEILPENIDEQDAYGYDAYSETDLLLPEGEHDENFHGASSPISMMALSQYGENTEGDAYFSPSSFISVNEVVDQALSFHHHPSSTRSTGRPLHRGMRPSLFGAIEFRDVVKSLKLDSNARALGVFGRSYTLDFYNDAATPRPAIERSRTMPNFRNYDRRRRISWTSVGGALESINQLASTNDHSILRRHSTTPDMLSSIHSSPALLPSNENHEPLNLPPVSKSESHPKPNLPRLLLIPPTPQQGRSPLLSPNIYTTSPTSFSPEAVNESSPTRFSFEDLPPLSPVLRTPPSPPPPSPEPLFTFLPAPRKPIWSLVLWDKIRPILFPSLTGFSQKSLFAKLIALVACPAIFVLALTLPVVEADDLNSQDDAKKHDTISGTDLRNASHLEPPIIRLDNQDLIIDDPPEIEIKNIRWNRWLTAIQFFLAPVFIVAVITLEQSSAGQWIIYALIFGVIASTLLYLGTDENQPPPFYWSLCFLGFAVAMVWIYLVANEVVGLLQALGLIMGLSDAILGLTIFAMGNSLGDFVANITIARMGFPMMAMSACFGGPMLNILLGIGISGTYMTLKTQESYKITVSPTLKRRHTMLSIDYIKFLTRRRTQVERDR